MQMNDSRECRSDAITVNKRLGYGWFFRVVVSISKWNTTQAPLAGGSTDFWQTAISNRHQLNGYHSDTENAVFTQEWLPRWSSERPNSRLGDSNYELLSFGCRKNAFKVSAAGLKRPRNLPLNWWPVSHWTLVGPSRWRSITVVTAFRPPGITLRDYAMFLCLFIPKVYVKRPQWTNIQAMPAKDGMETANIKCIRLHS